MHNAKLPLLFVVAVVGFLVLGAVGLVALTDRAGIVGTMTAGQAARTSQTPTGSSITAMTTAPRAGTTAPWAPEPTTARKSSSSTTAPSQTDSAPSSSPAAQGTPMTVSYSVTGSGPASVLTYWRGDHDIASEHEAALPWSRTVTLHEQSSIRLSVQVSSGDAHCQISVDGHVVAEAAGAYFVTCQTTPRPGVHDR
jgi:hypothetical protein